MSKKCGSEIGNMLNNVQQKQPLTQPPTTSVNRCSSANDDSSCKQERLSKLTECDGNLKDVQHDVMVSSVPGNIVAPPDGGWGWVVVVASFCCNLIVDGIIYSFGMFLPEIADTFQQNVAKVSLVGSLLSGTYLITGPFASGLANRYGFRSVTILGSIIACITFLASSCATSVEFLCLTYGIFGGVGFGFIFVPSVITVGFYFEKWRALATGIAVCGSGIGTFIMAPFSAYIIQKFTWRGALVIQAGLLLNCAIFGSLFRPIKQVMVDVPVTEQEIDTKPGTPLLRSKITKPSKSESLLNVYEDLGVTVEDKKSFFSNNNKYPTAWDMLCSEKRLSIAESALGNTMYLTDPELDSEDEGHTTINWSHKNGGYCGLPSEGLVLKNPSLGSIHKSYLAGARSHKSLAKWSPSMRSRRSTIARASLGNRPLYRDDIFFSADLKRLPQYTSQTSSLNYTMAVTRLPTYVDVMEEKKARCLLCPEAFRRALATMLDISLLRSSTFMLFAISGFCTAIGSSTIFMYTVDRAVSYGMEISVAMWLLSVIGIANTVGRVGFGVLSSIPCMNALVLNNVALSICGIVTIVSGTFSTSILQFSNAALFGLMIACFSTLRTIIIVDLLGLEKLTNAFGLLMLFQGVGAVIGPPMTGYFVSMTESRDTSFYMSGSFILVSAIMCYPLERINTWEQNKMKTKAERTVQNVA